MNSSNLKIFCVTNKKVNFVKKPQYYLSWVGTDEIPKNYISCNNKDNIYYVLLNIYFLINLLKSDSLLYLNSFLLFLLLINSDKIFKHSKVQ